MGTVWPHGTFGSGSTNRTYAHSESGVELMPHFLIQAAYTNDAWGTQVGNAQNVLDRIQPAVAKFSGKVESGYYSFGEFDVLLIAEFPTNSDAAAFAMAVTAGGATSAFKTTPLMTIGEGMDAMAKAGGSGYRPPSA